jgi:hypothetical protein
MSSIHFFFILEPSNFEASIELFVRYDLNAKTSVAKEEWSFIFFDKCSPRRVPLYIADLQTG